MLKITEDKKSDISTVYAYLVTPEKFPAGYAKTSDSFSCFNNTYKVGKEREFIEALHAQNPLRYTHFHITWDNCN